MKSFSFLFHKNKKEMASALRKQNVNFQFFSA